HVDRRNRRDPPKPRRRRDRRAARGASRHPPAWPPPRAPHRDRLALPDPRPRHPRDDVGAEHPAALMPRRPTRPPLDRRDRWTVTTSPMSLPRCFLAAALSQSMCPPRPVTISPTVVRSTSSPVASTRTALPVPKQAAESGISTQAQVSPFTS